MSRVQSIPPSHWSFYLRAASRRFLDQPATLDLTGPGATDRPIAHGLYFLGASLEGGHRPAVMLHLAPLGRPEAHLSHRIAEPAFILRELDARGELDRLVIEDRDGRRTALTFCEADPAPGERRRGIQRESDHCDHPRCPVT
ncbi:hypothetical protein D3C72_925510 [compost metagenome]